MLKKMLIPNDTVKSVVKIDLSKLKNSGIRGILLDFDNTLVKWNETRLKSGVNSWISNAKKSGFSICIVSNAVNSRLKKTAEHLGIPFVAQALKPSSLGIRRALKKLNLKKQETVMVGDQLFTDILAGKCSGIQTILVKPEKYYEQWWMKGVRRLENWIQK